MSLFGADGREVNVEEAVKTSQAAAQHEELARTEFKQIVALWERFCSVETSAESLDTMKGRELAEAGFPSELIEKFYQAGRFANEAVLDFPDKPVLIAQVCEFVVGVAAQHPAIINQVSFLGTLAAVKAGVVNEISLD